MTPAKEQPKLIPEVQVNSATSPLPETGYQVQY
jgi:hypothetical protein